MGQAGKIFVSVKIDIIKPAVFKLSLVPLSISGKLLYLTLRNNQFVVLEFKNNF
jgi:hypothetical protein